MLGFISPIEIAARYCILLCLGRGYWDLSPGSTKQRATVLYRILGGNTGTHHAIDVHTSAVLYYTAPYEWIQGYVTRIHTPALYCACGRGCWDPSLSHLNLFSVLIGVSCRRELLEVRRGNSQPPRACLSLASTTVLPCVVVLLPIELRLWWVGLPSGDEDGGGEPMIVNL